MSHNLTFTPHYFDTVTSQVSHYLDQLGSIRKSCIEYIQSLIPEDETISFYPTGDEEWDQSHRLQVFSDISDPAFVTHHDRHMDCDISLQIRSVDAEGVEDMDGNYICFEDIDVITAYQLYRLLAQYHQFQTEGSISGWD